jgi:hypothetical protein
VAHGRSNVAVLLNTSANAAPLLGTYPSAAMTV